MMSFNPAKRPRAASTTKTLDPRIGQRYAAAPPHSPLIPID
jgi:hypothetical protein